MYLEDKSQLLTKENKAYSVGMTVGIPEADHLDTQVRLGKDRLGKDSKEIKDLTPSKKSKAKPIRHKYGEYKNVLLSEDQMEKLKTEFPNDYQERIERLSEYCESSGKTYKNYLATIRSWARKEKSEPKNASSGYKRTGRREKLPEWAIDQEAYLKKKALERANRQSKAPF